MTTRKRKEVVGDGRLGGGRPRPDEVADEGSVARGSGERDDGASWRDTGRTDGGRTVTGRGTTANLVTRIGKLELRVPRDRSGEFSTALFERYARSEKALVAALAEMYVQGVSTRKVKAITEELCGHSFSASASARSTRAWTPRWAKVRPRQLDGAPIPT